MYIHVKFNMYILQIMLTKKEFILEINRYNVKVYVHVHLCNQTYLTGNMKNALINTSICIVK